ncbi:hypothetical protein AB6A40_009713 [Gnathostoma spinigerum]|uniref:Serpin domain-containing protein n=3 Tax=Gnathostoma spinigerum TaxID=75299 RepID=A0ABD6EXX9_9BILA
MMSTKGSFGLGHVDGVTVLTMPYSGDDIVMVVFLPDEKYGLANFEKDLTGERFSSLVNSSWTQSVEVKLPKFKIETRVDLNGPLKKLGIVDAFDNKANFSGMSEEPLRISKVVHKAFIEVNEEGTEAAAATGVVVMTRMMVHTQQFTADHPFLFAILRQRSVLFIGRYV